MTQKRPLGLKAQKNQKKRPKTSEEPKNATEILKPSRTEDSSFIRVGLPRLEKKNSKGSKGEDEEGEEDGLNFEDLIQLKIQADELIEVIEVNDGPIEEVVGSVGFDQVLNVLRGICHESIRQIELLSSSSSSSSSKEKEKEREKRDRGNEEEEDERIKLMIEIYHRLISWSAVELGFLISKSEKRSKEEKKSNDKKLRKVIVQEDEPVKIEDWLEIASKSLERTEKPRRILLDQDSSKLLNQNDGSDLEKISETIKTLEFVPNFVSILRSSLDELKSFQPMIENLKEILTDKIDLIKPSSTSPMNYILRMVERMMRIRSEAREESEESEEGGGGVEYYEKLLEILDQLKIKTQKKKKKDDDDDIGKEEGYDDRRLVGLRIGDCFLNLGSHLAESLENQFYPENEEEEDNDDEDEKDEEFLIPLDDPRYKISIRALKSAVEIFDESLKFIEEKRKIKSNEEENENKRLKEEEEEEEEILSREESLKLKLKESYLNLGNLCLPGKDREEFYLLADLQSIIK